MKTVVGIDYSLTSPCVCVSNNNSFSDSYFYFLTDRKFLTGQVLNILGDLHDNYLTDQQRYENIASWVLNILSNLDKSNTDIIIEDYSFGSKGKVFNLAENCGLLKYLLYKEGYNFFTVAPSAVKKYATGKGNAGKQQMYDAFYELSQIDLIWLYAPTTHKLGSPVTDIIDSFYLAKYYRNAIAINDMGKLNRGTNKSKSNVNRPSSS